MNYLNDPEAIYRQSFAAIRAEADLSSLPAETHAIALRMIHACGMVDIIGDLRIDPLLPAALTAALGAHRPIFTDCEMVRSGIIKRNLPPKTEIICTLNDGRTRDIGITGNTTRSAAAVELWKPHLAGSIVVIGNAPTALFALLDLIDRGGPLPSAIIAMPVGFVGAAESKAELVSDPRGIAFATLLGRRGGSALATAALNAIIAERAA
ncbi:MAG TPA: precorrin-8X methylmutase [Aestuariivirgaceae bacterium]|nr:precorrin-8X methylmutase [Aestuariivirgaceae bacterium]